MYQSCVQVDARASGLGWSVASFRRALPIVTRRPFSANEFYDCDHCSAFLFTHRSPLLGALHCSPLCQSVNGRSELPRANSLSIVVETLAGR